MNKTKYKLSNFFNKPANLKTNKIDNLQKQSKITKSKETKKENIRKIKSRIKELISKLYTQKTKYEGLDVVDNRI